MCHIFPWSVKSAPRFDVRYRRYSGDVVDYGVGIADIV